MSGSLVVHGLHYGLIAVGSVLVVALLWRGRTRRRASGRRHEETAGCVGDHQRRVSELREAARSGRLGAARLEPERRDAPTLPL